MRDIVYHSVFAIFIFHFITSVLRVRLHNKLINKLQSTAT